MSSSLVDGPVAEGDDAQAMAVGWAKTIDTKYFSDGFWNDPELDATFPVIFAGIINLYMSREESLKGLSAAALLRCFQRLDRAFVRRECLKLVSVGCWESLSSVRQAFEFGKNPQLLDVYNRVKGVPENRFIGLVIDDYAEHGYAGNALLLQYILLQWATRRYVGVLMDDKCLLQRGKNDGFLDSLGRLLGGLVVSSDTVNSCQTFSSYEEYAECVYERIETFQLFINSLSKGNILASASFTSLSDPGQCRELLQAGLDDAALQSISTRYGWPAVSLVEKLVSYLSLRRDCQPPISDEHLPDHTTISSVAHLRSLLLPLSPSFLNQDDYVQRYYNLLRYEFTSSLLFHMDAALKRCKPLIDKKLGLVFDGWYRYGASCLHVDDSAYVISLSPSTSSPVVDEWRSLKSGESVYICKIAKQGEAFVFETAKPARVNSMLKDRSKEPSGSGSSNRSFTNVFVTLDAVDKEANFMLRFDPRDNSPNLLSVFRGLSLGADFNTLIDASTLFLGRKMGDGRAFSSPRDWYEKSSTSCLIVAGPPSTGKTAQLVELVRTIKDKRVLVLVATTESADFLIPRLLRDGCVDANEFLRLGYSPSQLAEGRIESYMRYRDQLLRRTADILDESNAEAALASTCESALFSLGHMGVDLDGSQLELVRGLKRLLPLEYIQNERYREEYMLKYSSRVSLMTYGYAAVNSSLISTFGPDVVLMDDLHLCPEYLSVVSLFSKHDRADTRVVLFGNPSIEPVSDGELNAQYNFGSSLFRRLSMLKALPTVALSTIFNVPAQMSKHFSDPHQVSDCAVELVFISSESSADNVLESRQNVDEAEALVEYFLDIQGDDMCRSVVILAPYNAQVDLLSDVLRSKMESPTIPKVYTLDKFSGAQADVVLCSLTVPRMTKFLSDRLGSLLTRAMRKLVIFLDPNVAL